MLCTLQKSFPPVKPRISPPCTCIKKGVAATGLGRAGWNQEKHEDHRNVSMKLLKISRLKKNVRMLLRTGISQRKMCFSTDSSGFWMFLVKGLTPKQRKRSSPRALQLRLPARLRSGDGSSHLKNAPETMAGQTSGSNMFETSLTKNLKEFKKESCHKQVLLDCSRAPS